MVRFLDEGDEVQMWCPSSWMMSVEASLDLQIVHRDGLFMSNGWTKIFPSA